jgi:hypothetical protein
MTCCRGHSPKTNGAPIGRNLQARSRLTARARQGARNRAPRGLGTRKPQGSCQMSDHPAAHQQSCGPGSGGTHAAIRPGADLQQPRSHARTAVGVNGLPFNFPVEIEAGCDWTGRRDNGQRRLTPRLHWSENALIPFGEGCNPIVLRSQPAVSALDASSLRRHHLGHGRGRLSRAALRDG